MRFNFIRVWGGFWSLMGSKLFYPLETGKISDNLYAIRDRDMNMFVYSNGEDTFCVDAGYINNHYLSKEFERVGIDPGTITHVFLTHFDMDHAGALDQDSRTNWFSNARVFVSDAEKPLIDGILPRSRSFLNPVQITRGFNFISDGEEVTVGNLTVKAIATPGHTPGHMSYLINGDILCSGDALVLKDGKIEPFYRTWNMDHDQAVQSVKKLAALDKITILCTAHTKCSFDFKHAIRM